MRCPLSIFRIEMADIVYLASQDELNFFPLASVCVKTIRIGGNDFKSQIIVMAPQWISKTAHGRALEEGFDPLKWFECAMTTLWKTHWRHLSIIYNLHNSKHHELEQHWYCRNTMEYALESTDTLTSSLQSRPGDMEVKALRIFYGLVTRGEVPKQQPLLVGRTWLTNIDYEVF